ncbi:unnamed protein product [Lactuca saligna]|uniref:Transcription factor CBF/NF-Y/archaeal histone domain-containing protein n=1 Tax=Lactuca saligna TaxID=75948 RepID=A0AA35YWR6_LACSI|nr:unnamed protein product [Lactuca saligna]
MSPANSPLSLYRASSCFIVSASDPRSSIRIRLLLSFDPDYDVLLIGAFDLPESKMEPMDIVGKAKEDASLPKATMTKIIKEMLPPDVRVARDTQDLLIECCVEFINLISSESNEVCSREDKRTIAPEHVLKALEVLGFGDYIEEVYAAYEQHKLETVDTVRGGKCTNGAEMTEEEALAEQQRMFAEARARMNGVAKAPPKQAEAEPSLNS